MPDKIDTSYLKKFVAWINRNLAKWRFIIVVGGGCTNTIYNKAAMELGMNDKENLDRIGVYATRLNAQLIRTLFDRKSEEELYCDPSKPVNFSKPIMFAAGYKSGWSTDYIAVMIAKKLRIGRIINLTNIDYVYDKDPAKFRNAKALPKISWVDFRKIVGSKWEPRLHAPFDPIASKLAQKNRISVAVVNGRNLKNLQKVLDGKGFIGTIIQ